MMDTLIEALSSAEAFPGHDGPVEVIQTHISVVCLVGEDVYKLKKPVSLGFVDFSTPALRAHFCREEVRLNQRLAPSVYLGVVPVFREAGGAFRVGGEGSGEVVEQAVWMRRLPESATLRSRVEAGSLGEAEIGALGRRLAEFHRGAKGGEEVARGGAWETVAGNCRENFDQTCGDVGALVHESVYRQIKARTEGLLASLRPLIEARARAGVPRDTHGDLRLDHVYLFPEREVPEDIAIIDCVEFNARFRHADPVADIAFLVMELEGAGERALARAFVDAWCEASGDEVGRALLPLYTAYRAVVRAKVEGIRSREVEVGAEGRAEARSRARAHWLLAHARLSPPHLRPALVLMAGLPGTGKSSAARSLADLGFEVLRTDEVRKEMAGLDVLDSAGAAFGEGLYTDEGKARVYGEVLRRAGEALFEGRRVVVDAGFWRGEARRRFLDMARGLFVPALVLCCEVPPEIARARLDARQGDASDADRGIYEVAAGLWEPPSGVEEAHWRRLDTSAGPGAVSEAISRIVVEAGLWIEAMAQDLYSERGRRGVPRAGLE